METLQKTGLPASLLAGQPAPLLHYPARPQGTRYVVLTGPRQSNAAFGLLMAALLALPGYGQQLTASTATGPKTTGTPKAPAIADGDWPSQNRTLTSERYSPLKQITAANVGTLKNVGTAELGEKGSFQSGIIVVNNTMFVTTFQNTFALDPVTGQQKWKHHAAFTPPKAGLQVNRGVAYADGKVFRGIDSGYMLALDAKTGKQLWQAKAADPLKGETLAAAPIAWNGLVFMGQAGGDVKGVRGRMMAFRQSDGKQMWNFEFIPLTGKAGDTWQKSTPNNPRSGAATWSTYTLDADQGLLYVATGNAAPDFDLKVRPGANLYANCIVILDAKTGAYKDHHQLTATDFHDWDLASAPVLVKTAGGKNLLVEGSKDGYVYAFDQASPDKALYKTEVTTIENAEAPLTADAQTRFCPGKHGGVQQNGPAYYPAGNLLLVNAIDWCTSVKLAPRTDPPSKPGQQWTGAITTALFGTDDPKTMWKGWLTALDAENGTVKWKYQSPTPLIAGVTTTASGLVITGDLNGDLMIFDVMSGKQLWKQNTGAAIGSGVVTYAVNDKQYIAVGVGMTSPVLKTDGGNAKVMVFALP